MLPWNFRNHAKFFLNFNTWGSTSFGLDNLTKESLKRWWWPVYLELNQRIWSTMTSIIPLWAVFSCPSVVSLAQPSLENVHLVCELPNHLRFSETYETFTEIRRDFTKDFGGLKKTGGTSLMNGDTNPGNWYFAVGIISDVYKPFFPGPKDVPETNTADVRLYIKKDC